MSGVTFERLPPERRQAAPLAAAAGGCCCCCCCCLHTVASVVGALTAKPTAEPGAVPTAVIGTDAVAPKYSVTKEYWATVAVLSLVVFPMFMHVWSEGQWLDDGAAVIGIVYLLVFPVIQLAASLVVALRNAWSRRPGKEHRLRHLGSITARAFVGGVIGVVLMLPLIGIL